MQRTKNIFLRRLLASITAAILLTLLAPPGAGAASYYWVLDGTCDAGVWSDTSCWTTNADGTPSGGAGPPQTTVDEGYLLQSDGASRIVTFDSPNPSFRILKIDATDGGAITLSQSQDSLTIATVVIGDSGTGAFIQSGGTNTFSLTLGLGSDSSGTYDLRKGDLSGVRKRIGIDGSGTFIQSGGTTSSYELTLGRGLGSGTYTQSGGTNTITTFFYLGYGTGDGTYNLIDGDIYAESDEYISYGGTGDFTQSGGTHSITNNLYVGYGAYSSGAGIGSGTYDLLKGTLSAANEYLGYWGDSKFTQSGGTNTVANALYIGTDADGTGRYALSGGTLNAQTVDINVLGTLELTGGTLNAGNIFDRGVIYQGGVLNVTADTTLLGDFMLEAGSTTTIDAKLTMKGQTMMAGPGGVGIGAAGELRGAGYLDVEIDNAGTLGARSGNLTVAGTTFTNTGLVKNYAGANLFVESPTLNHTGSVEINSGGSVVFDAAVTNVAGETVTLYGGTLSTPTLTNDAGGTVSGFGTLTGDLVNFGDVDLYGDSTIVGDLLNNTGALFQVRNSRTLITGAATNDGTIHTLGGEVVFEGGLTNSGVLSFDPATITFADDLVVTEDGYLEETGPEYGDRLIMEADFINRSTQNLLWDTDQSILQFNGSGTDLDPQTFEVSAADIGAYLDGWDYNFVFDTLHIGTADTYVRFIDDWGNSAPSLGGLPEIWTREAMYINNLILEEGATLDLNGYNLYYSGLFTDNGGRIDISGGGELIYVAAAVPEPSTLLLLGSGLAALAFVRRLKRRT